MAKKQQFENDGKTYTVVEKKPFYKKWWFWLLIVILIMVVFSQTGKDKETTKVEKASSTDTEQSTQDENKEVQESEEPKAVEYEITNVELVEEDYSKYVTGVLKNNSEKDKSYLQITFPYTDADGNKLGTAFDNVDTLKAGETWKFKAIILEGSDEEIKVDLENPEVSGW